MFTETQGFPALRKALSMGREALQAQTGLGTDKTCLIARAFDAESGAAIRSTLLAKTPLGILEGLGHCSPGPGSHQGHPCPGPPQPRL